MAKKVVVAMSGGVDSSVAAALLKEQGYDVYGITMKLANWESREGRSFGGCCGSKDFYDARSVAQTLGIPHYSYDYVETFKVSVINYFKESYMKAETPNPCIACNQHVKFDALLRHALALGADYLATGHYARIESRSPSPLVGDHRSDALMDDGLASIKEGSLGGGDEGDLQSDPSPVPSPTRGEGPRRYLLKKALDPAKDQSYVLYGLGQEELSKVLFPLGVYTKPQIRELAHKYGLRTADKPDSYEICFVPNEDYKQFIDEEVSAAERPAGPIRHKDGRVLGQHRGLPYYTIGQREGLGIAVGHPLYVVGLEKESNTLVVSEKADVYSKEMVVRDVTWVAGTAPAFPTDVTVKIRSKHTEAKATLTARASPQPRQTRQMSGEASPAVWRASGESPDVLATSPSRERGSFMGSSLSREGEGGRRPGEALAVTFKEPQSAVAPGQAAVFYQGDTVLGGGVIDHVIHH